MNSLQGVLPFVVDSAPQKRIVFEVSRAQLTSDPGLLPLCQFDELIGLSDQFAAALPTEQGMLERELNRWAPNVDKSFDEMGKVIVEKDFCCLQKADALKKKF